MFRREEWMNSTPSKEQSVFGCDNLMETVKEACGYSDLLQSEREIMTSETAFRFSKDMEFDMLRNVRADEWISNEPQPTGHPKHHRKQRKMQRESRKLNRR